MRLLSVLLLVAAAPVAGQQVSRIDGDEAADRARVISLSASSLSVPGAGSGSGDSAASALQRRVDEVALVASELESEIRSGSDKASSRRLYEQLQGIRLRMLELAIHQKVEISPQDAALFEAMLADLAAYYAE